jgi:hypothetical protein
MGGGVIRISFLIVAVLLSSAQLFAGDVLRLSGVVTDPTGALVPQAKITAENTGTGLRQTMQSNDEGWYEFLLPAGTYRLEVEASGFRSFVRDGLVLGPTAPLRADVLLQLESQQQTVEVIAEGTELDTSSTQVGESISQDKMTAVPLNGRSLRICSPCRQE